MTYDQTDTRNHYKLSNLNKLTREGLMRIAVKPNYKMDCVYSPYALCPTLRAEGSVRVIGFEVD